MKPLWKTVVEMLLLVPVLVLGAWFVVAFPLVTMGLLVVLAGYGVVLNWKVRGGERAAERSACGLCPRCGYDLRATPDRCPECGFPEPSPT